MAETYFPFNSIVTGGVPDRPGNAESLSSYLAAFFSNGILLQDEETLRVSVDAGMSLNIAPGACVINGKLYQTDAVLKIDLDAANASLSRIDRVVVRLDSTNRLMEIAVLTGDASSEPVAIELTRDGYIYELCLAEINVGIGVSNLTADDITDTRLDMSLCGVSNIPEHVQDVEYGGTGATTPDGARENLEIFLADSPNFTGVAIVDRDGNDYGATTTINKDSSFVQQIGSKKICFLHLRVNIKANIPTDTSVKLATSSVIKPIYMTPLGSDIAASERYSMARIDAGGNIWCRFSEEIKGTSTSVYTFSGAVICN